MEPRRVRNIVMFDWVYITEWMDVKMDDGTVERTRIPSPHPIRVLMDDDDLQDALAKRLYIWHEHVDLKGAGEATEAAHTFYWEYKNPEKAWSPFDVPEWKPS